MEAMSSNQVLRLESVTCSYGGFRAVVDDVTFDLQAGEVVALVGPNGAGKTTLLNVISGIHRIDSGTIRLAGVDVSRRPSWFRARLGMARSFQLVRLFGDLTIARNVELGKVAKADAPGFVSSLLHLPKHQTFRRKADQDANSALAEVSLGGLSQRLATDVSHGQSRRVEIARALVAEPSVLLLDEPTSGLHSGVISELVPIIRNQAAQGTSVLLVEHNLRFVREVATRVLVFDRGRLIADGTFDEVMRRPDVVEAYLGGKPENVKRGEA